MLKQLLYLSGFTFLLVGSAATVSAQATPDAAGGVYVRDSDVAVDKFAQADRMERLGEWGKAADIYQELLQKQADRVIALPSDATRFESVVEAVQKRLSGWKADALAVYRDRYGPEAQSLLEQSEAEHRDDATDDLAGLHRVFANYFVTDAAKIAGLRLMDAAFENGDFSAAVWIGTRLLDRHPMLLDDRARVLYRTALAEHFQGNASATTAPVNARLAELRQKFPQALGTVRGVDVVLADSLTSELAQAVVPPVAASGESWPMPFGSPDRSRVPAVSGLDGARLFKVPLDDGLAHPPPGSVAALKQTIDRNRKLGYTLGVVPVVDRGELFFQDNAHIYAINLESGLPLSGWQETYPGEGKGQYTIAAWPMPASQSSTLCVADDSLFAVMGFVDSSPVMVPGRMTRSPRLICLDRRTGRERWTFDPQQLPAEPAALRQLTISGVPLVIGANVYVLGSGGQGIQFEDCYVICLDRATGTYKWSSYIASANDPSAMFNPEGTGATPDAAAHLAYAAGRLFVTTDVGAVASLDATDGSIAWLDLYPRDATTVRPGDVFRWNRPPSAEIASRHNKPWTSNPIIVRDGKVYACPSDANALLIYDAGSGAPVQHVGLSYKTSLDNTGPSETADTLIGITGDTAVLASDRTVFCIQLANYDPAKGIDNLRWFKTFTKSQDAQGPAWPEDSIRGRPFLTKESVIVPLAWSLVSLSLRSGAAQTTFPPTGTWDLGEDGPGNVLLTSDHLIVAGAQHVNVYTDLAVATGRLDRAIAERPDDAQLRLRYAEMLFATRRFDGPNGAMSKLDEAAKLLGVKPTTDAVRRCNRRYTGGRRCDAADTVI